MTKIITYQKWSDYLKEIATAHLLLHPTGQDVRYYEFEFAFKGINLLYPSLISVPPSGRITDGKSDNIHADFIGEFLVVDKCGLEDYPAQLAAYDKGFEIGWDIITKFYKDLRSETSTANKAMNSFDPNNVSWQPVGPEFDNSFGIHFFVPFANPKSLFYDSAKWHP